jgi:Fic family protein
LAKYIYQLSGWPAFTWNQELLNPLLLQLRQQQENMLQNMGSMDPETKAATHLEILTQDILRSCEMEGELLSAHQIRAAIAKKLGIEVQNAVPWDRHTDGIVEMMVDATLNYKKPLTKDRLFGWHMALFPTGYSGVHKIMVGNWRINAKKEPLKLVSGLLDKPKVHFVAPPSMQIDKQMDQFLLWFNKPGLDRLMKAAIAHLWFMTLHPFEDGNSRIARAITEMQLAKADATHFRFYSMSNQLLEAQKEYYFILEQTQKGSLDITIWLQWFLGCIEKAYASTPMYLSPVLVKFNFWKKNATVTLNKRQRHFIENILEGFDEKLNTSTYAKLNNCSRDTALRDVTDLIKKNLFTKNGGAGKNTTYALVNETE